MSDTEDTPTPREDRVVGLIAALEASVKAAKEERDRVVAERSVVEPVPPQPTWREHLATCRAHYYPSERCDCGAAVPPEATPRDDREPQTSDGPEYHADHAAWRERQRAVPLLEDPQPQETTAMADMIPVARLDLEGAGSPLVTDISTREGWAAVWDTMALDVSDPFVPIKDAAEGWTVTLSAMPRSEYEALQEHGGW